MTVWGIVLYLPEIEPYRGAQVKVLIPPISTAFSLSIQKPKRTIFSLKSYVDWQLIPQSGYVMLRDALHSYQNIIITGMPKSGKTSLLNALLNEVSQRDRVLISEEHPELRASIDDLIYLKCTPTRNMAHLIKNSLDMNLDRLIVGEVKEENISQLLDAWPLKNFGSGCIASFCASSIEDALKQFQMAVQTAHPDMSNSDAIEKILNTVDVLVHLEKSTQKHERPYISRLVRLVSYDHAAQQFIFNNFVDCM